MSAERLIANFVRIAAEDLEGARVLADAGNRNAIKHDLAEMVDLVPDQNPLKSVLRAIEHLSQYATAYRYPVSSSASKRIPRAPDAADLRNALTATAAALAATVTRFGVDLAQPDAPAGNAGPIR